MDHPIAYLITHQFRNRVRSGLRKLRRPRIALAALLVAGYIGFTVFLMSLGNDSVGADREGPALGLIAPLGILFIALASWVSLRRARLHPLGFRIAEVQLLFPLPIPRRTLVAYRLLAMQPGLIILSFVVPLVLRGAAPLSPVPMVGRWVFFNICYLHLVVAAFAHGTKREAGAGRFLFAWLPGICLWTGVIGGLLLSGIDLRRLFSVEILAEAERICTASAFAYALAPFRLLGTLVLSRQGSPVPVDALAWGLAILALHVIWIFLQDSRFEEASLRAAELRAARLEAWKRGEWSPWRRRPRHGPVKVQPFRLAPQGSAVLAYVWNGLLSAGRRYTVRNGVIAVVGCISLGVVLRGGAETLGITDTGAAPLVIPIVANIAFLIFMIRVLGRRREEMGVVETMSILKPLPVRGRTVFLGRLLGEVTVTQALYLLLWSLGAGFLASDIAGDLPFGSSVIALSFAAMAALVALGHAIGMVMALWLPFTAAFQAGPSGFAHNLMALIFRGLGLAALLLPVGIIVTVAAFVVPGVRSTALICLATGGGMVAVETAVLVSIGGRLYDRFDVAAEK